MTPRSVCGAVAALFLFLPLACGDDTSSGGAGNSTSTAGNNAGGGVNTGGGNAGGGNAGGGNTGGGNTGGGNTGGGNTGGMPPLQIAECQGHVYECGDLEDNDGDGLTDSYDPDCLGPCDNTEGSYFGGIPGQNNAPCKMDCYFDQDTGAGNDDCYWDHRCDTHSVDPNFYPQPWNNCGYENPNYQYNANPPYTCTTGDAAQSDTCMQVCGPLTPNGCDCFGCCELPAGSGAYVFLGSVGVDESTVCTIADINNPAVCHPCDPVAACLNECGECEVCIGKPEPGPECDPGEGGGGAGGNGSGGGSSGSQCPTGIQPCGLPGQDPCAFGEYCITGCCIPEPAG
jgi:hypothetical protein